MSTFSSEERKQTTASSESEGFRETAERNKILEIRKGSYVFKAQERREYVYFLLQGRVKIGTLDPLGREVMKEVIFDQEIFGETALFTDDPMNDFAVVLKPGSVACIPLEVARTQMKLNRRFAAELFQFLGKKLRDQQRRIEALIFLDARARIVDFLKQIASDKGEQIGYEILVRNFALTHHDIAHMTGTSRQTVTMVLKELKDGNLIYIDRRNLLFREIDKLA